MTMNCRVTSESAGSHVRTSGSKVLDGDDHEYVPVHWMGASRVQMTMVRRASQTRLKAGSRKPRDKGASAAAVNDAKAKERSNWRRLLRTSERLVVEHEELQTGDYQPDPVSDAGCRVRLLSNLQPPRLHRLDARIEEYERHQANPVATPPPVDEASSSSEQDDDEAAQLRRQRREQAKKRKARIMLMEGIEEPPVYVKQASTANLLVDSVFKSESDNHFLCPFSGEMVPPEDLEAHMDEWRSVMRAELTSLQHDATCGPRIGLFVVPVVPTEIPQPGASKTEVKEWNDLALSLYKNGYVMVKPENRKYHWTEVRKILTAPLPPSRPWERSADEIDEDNTKLETEQSILEEEEARQQAAEAIRSKNQSRSASVSPLRRKQYRPFHCD